MFDPTSKITITAPPPAPAYHPYDRGADHMSAHFDGLPDDGDTAAAQAVGAYGLLGMRAAARAFSVPTNPDAVPAALLGAYLAEAGGPQGFTADLMSAAYCGAMRGVRALLAARQAAGLPVPGTDGQGGEAGGAPAMGSERGGPVSAPQEPDGYFPGSMDPN